MQCTLCRAVCGVQGVHLNETNSSQRSQSSANRITTEWTRKNNATECSRKKLLRRIFFLSRKICFEAVRASVCTLFACVHKRLMILNQLYQFFFNIYSMFCFFVHLQRISKVRVRPFTSNNNNNHFQYAACTQNRSDFWTLEKCNEIKYR